MGTDSPIQAGDIVTRGADSRRMRVRSVNYRADEFIVGYGSPSDYLYARCEWDQPESESYCRYRAAIGSDRYGVAVHSADFRISELRPFVAAADRSREAEVTATPEFSHLMAGVQADPMAAPPRMAAADWLAERDCPALAQGVLDGTACVCGGRGGEWGYFSGTSQRMWVACRGPLCKRRLSVEPDASGRRPSRQL